MDAQLAKPLIERVLSEKADVLFKVEPIKELKLPLMQLRAFDTVICAQRGEVTVERYARIKHGQVVCIPCAEQV